MRKILNKRLIIVCVILAFVTICAAFWTYTEKAKGEPPVELSIIRKNLAFQDNVYILYAVDSQGIENKEDIEVLVWNEPQAEYTYGEQDITLSYNRTMEIESKEYPVFILDSLSAKQMTDTVYAVAYYDGHYSVPTKYSILQYAYNRQKVSENLNFKALLTNMLNYGASAQTYYDYHTERLANATYYTIQTENGTLPDGFHCGIYKSGTEISITRTEQGGKVFKEWVDNEDNVLGTNSTLNYTMDKDITVTATYVNPTPDEYFTFTLLGDDTYEIYAKDVNDIPAEIVIPSTYNAKTVTSIGEWAFYNCTGLTNITIPESVTTIENSAFYGCSGLTSITIPDSVTSIGENAFWSCRNLTSITIPYGITRIERSTFSNCWNLTSITIPDTVTSIGAYAFNACYSITTITIPDTVTSIGAGAFIHCEYLASIAIPDGIANIEYDTFWDCHRLASIVIPSSVTSIGDRTFCNCRNLTDITIPDNVTSIGDHVFDSCRSLTSINIPDGVTDIGKYAFFGCIALTSISIPNGVTSIGESAFSGCNSLTTITIPDTVTDIGSEAFINCNSLISITLPNGLTNIYFGTFWFCENLTSITIPNGVISIGNYAFQCCYHLTNITIPDTVTSIGNLAFRYCGLTSVTIGNGVTSIGNEAFRYCDDLTSIYYTGTASEWAQIDGLDNLMGYGANNKTLYINSEPVTEVVLENIPEIKPHAFAHCLSLTSITIPDSVTSIGNLAFSCCFNLTSVTIGNGVTSIGEDAFLACTSLTEITIPDSVTSIGYGAFSTCTNLVSIILSDNITSIENGMFQGCSSLSEITIPDGVTSIGVVAFQDCSSLSEIIIPDSVTSIGDYAFENCTGLTSVTIGNGVTSIENEAFYNCNSLTEITIPDSIISIGELTFAYCSDLTSISFDGTIEEWNAVSKGTNWKYRIPATVVYCSDGEEPISEIYSLSAGYSIDLPDYLEMQPAVLEFDLKIELGGMEQCRMQLLQDDSNYFGVYIFVRDGVEIGDANADAIQVTFNDDELLHVVIALHELTTKIGDPVKITQITDYMHSTIGVDGYITNVSIIDVDHLM